MISAAASKRRFFNQFSGEWRSLVRQYSGRPDKYHLSQQAHAMNTTVRRAVSPYVFNKGGFEREYDFSIGCKRNKLRGYLFRNCMKKIGFLSFGHWADHPSYKTRSAADTLLQSIELAVAAEQIGIDGAYFRVHHFAAQLASPFPLLGAASAEELRDLMYTADIS